MKRRKALPFWLLAGLFLGTNLGAVVDQATGVAIDPALLGIWRDCAWCAARGREVLVEVGRANQGLLLGGLLGLVAGAAAWGLFFAVGAPHPAALPKPVRGRRAESATRSRSGLLLWLRPPLRGRCPYCSSGKVVRVHRTSADRLRFWAPVKRYRCSNCGREYIARSSHL